jgi:hypothetical protein
VLGFISFKNLKVGRASVPATQGGQGRPPHRQSPASYHFNQKPKAHLLRGFRGWGLGRGRIDILIPAAASTGLGRGVITDPGAVAVAGIIGTIGVAGSIALTPALAALTPASHTHTHPLALLGEAHLRQTQRGCYKYRHDGNKPVFSLHRGLLKQVLKNFKKFISDRTIDSLIPEFPARLSLAPLAFPSATWEREGKVSWPLQVQLGNAPNMQWVFHGLEARAI